MTAWPECWRGICRATWERGSNKDKASFQFLWNCVAFKEMKAFLAMGASYANLIRRMASAKIIYPDGTYNVEFYQQLLRMQRK